MTLPETKPLIQSRKASTKSSPNYAAIAIGVAVALVALVALVEPGAVGLRGSGVVAPGGNRVGRAADGDSVKPPRGRRVDRGDNRVDVIRF